MADDDILVSIAANIEQLLAGFNKAADDVGASLSTIESHIGNASSSLEEKLAPASEHAAESLKHIHEESEGLGGALEDLKGKFDHALEVTGIAIAYEAFEKLRDVMAELSERAVEFGHLGESLGVGAVAIQGLEDAAEDAGVSTSKLERVMFMLTQRMEQATQQGGEAALRFNKLGISNDDLTSSTFNIIDAMQRLGEETNSNAELIALLGARSAMVIPIMREMAKNHDMAAESARQVNALLPSEISAMLAYHKTMNDVKDVVENLASRIMIALIPMMQELVVEFRDLTTVGPVAQLILNGIGEALKTIVMVVTELAYGFKGAIDIILNALNLLISPIAAVGAAINALAHGNFSEAKNILIDGFKDIGKNWNTIFTEFDNDVNRGEAAIARMRTALSGLDEVHPSLEREEEPKHKQMTPTPDGWDISLLKDSIKIKEGMLQQTYKDTEEMLHLEEQAYQNAAKGELDAQLGSLKQQEVALQEKVKNGSIIMGGELGAEERLIGQKLQANIAYYEKLKSLAAAAGKDTTKFDAEEVKAAQNAATQMAEAHKRAADETRKVWDTAFKPIQASFTDNIAQMIEGTESFGDAWRNIMASILDSFIKMIANLVVQWLLGMLENMLVSKTTAISQITANAGVAASAAMGSVAAIPFVGWAMAPEVGASTYALAQSYAASVSAAGGMDIPAGMNPKAQLHEKEMVLPASIADPLRQMISSGGGQKRGPGIKLQVLNGGDDFYVITKANMHAHIADLNSRFAFGTKGPFV